MDKITKPDAALLEMYRKRVLARLTRRDYEPATVAELADDLRAEDREQFERTVRWLALQKLLDIDGSDRVKLVSVASRGSELRGVFKRGPRGAGFVEPEEPVREGSIYVPPEETLDALPGDRVVVELARNRGRERSTGKQEFIGRVVEVVQRKKTSFSGVIEQRGKDFVAMLDGKDMDRPIVLRDAQSKNVKPGDKVIVEMLVFPEGLELGEGVISRVLGDAGEPDVETAAVLATYGLTPEFDEDVMEEARVQNRRFTDQIERFLAEGSSALPDRLDLTSSFVCTIDPPDAKDYDDALSISRTAEGGWEVAVHIADVAFFVEPGTALDTEAKHRGNSTYLPRLVVPMLPELLSNGICSLQERVPRFVKSAFIRYDRRGHVLAEGVGQGVISSAKRLTYLEAQALIDGDETEARKHARTEPNYTPQLRECLLQLDACSRAIRERRRSKGMIHLDLPEVELVFDESGRVIDAHPEDDAYTHTLIEMFMVEANEVVARLFERLDVPLIRRVHEAPSRSGQEGMRKIARVAGFVIPQDPTREQLQALLDATRGTAASRAVHMAVLRTLARAEYRPVQIGHFALASDAYAHFTSPIRRYADLTAHRAIQAYLGRTANGTSAPKDDKARVALGNQLKEDALCPPTEELAEIARHITFTEDNSATAEVELRKFLVLQFLQGKIGESFTGVVTGMNPKGVFVQIDKFVIDGFIKTEDLPGDVTRTDRPPRWRLDDRTGSLVDEVSGRSFAFGDSLEVSIANVDMDKRQLDLVVTNAASRAGGKAKSLSLGGGAGGLASGKGAGFKGELRTGADRRSAKSKSRDRGKKDHRRDR